MSDFELLKNYIANKNPNKPLNENLVSRVNKLVDKLEKDLQGKTDAAIGFAERKAKDHYEAKTVFKELGISPDAVVFELYDNEDFNYN